VEKEDSWENVDWDQIGAEGRFANMLGFDVAPGPEVDVVVARAEPWPLREANCDVQIHYGSHQQKNRLNRYGPTCK